LQEVKVESQSSQSKASPVVAQAQPAITPIQKLFNAMKKQLKKLGGSKKQEERPA
jgi:hypothetical protein